MVPSRPILPIRSPASLVEITGVSAPGDYAAVVDGSRMVRLIGQSGLPAQSVPSVTTLTQLLTGGFEQPVGQGRRPRSFRACGAE